MILQIIPRNVSSVVEDVVKRMLSVSPKNRITAKYALSLLNKGRLSARPKSLKSTPRRRLTSSFVQKQFAVNISSSLVNQSKMSIESPKPLAIRTSKFAETSGYGSNLFSGSPKRRYGLLTPISLNNPRNSNFFMKQEKGRGSVANSGAIVSKKYEINVPAMCCK